MAYFRTLPKLQTLLNLFSRDESWAICIDADPDAMASALALRRIMSRRVKEVVIAKINDIARPDNLAMIRYTHIAMEDFTPALVQRFQRFAIVDSQPHHNPAFADIPFSVIIDHHPLPKIPAPVAYADIRPEYGATSTMMTEYLYNLDIEPGKLMATALQFGIKTDTSNFERGVIDVDLRAFQHLGRFSNPGLLSRISRSEFHLNWLEHFAKAFSSMYALGSGQFCFIGEVGSPDILVNIADLFMRVYEVRWVAVSGIYEESVVIIFRSDGISQDVGKLATLLFSDFGSAGGHKTMARAEFPLSAVGKENPEIFIWQRLKGPQKLIAAKTKEAH